MGESGKFRQDYEMLELGSEGEDSQAEATETVSIGSLDFLCDAV